jgi:hypothetical protein
LRGVQPGRGAREVQLFGDRQEVPQMPQFHGDRLDGAAKNRNPRTHAVSRGTPYDEGHPAGAPVDAAHVVVANCATV